MKLHRVFLVIFNGVSHLEKHSSKQHLFLDNKKEIFKTDFTAYRYTYIGKKFLFKIATEPKKASFITLKF